MRNARKYLTHISLLLQLPSHVTISVSSLNARVGRHRIFYPPIGKLRGNHFKPYVTKISTFPSNYLLENSMESCGIDP
jgi:hypothetical protein